MTTKVLCSIGTRGRYHTTLPLALQSIINQTRKVDKLIIFDDNDKPEDMRQNSIYSNLFMMMDLKGIMWEWVFAARKGTHYNHQAANITAATQGYQWVWRIDDDAIAEPNVLEKLLAHADNDVGCVGGSVLTPPLIFENISATGRIEDIYTEPNIQWKKSIIGVHNVDHLHCSFLYRAGVHDYNLGLSRVAHREETLFSYGIKQKGYRLLVVPDCTTWHLKSPSGGIRSETNEQLYAHDEQIFRNIVNLKDHTIVVLNCGMGDHIVFKRVLPDIVNPIVFSCYPEIIPGRSIAEAQALFGDIESYSIYRKMDQWNWKDSLENAFRKMYVK